MSNYSEKEIAQVVLNLINEKPGIRTSKLIQDSRIIMNPLGEDLTTLTGRKDDKFSQKVRNIKSHNTLQNATFTVGKRNRQWYPILTNQKNSYK